MAALTFRRALKRLQYYLAAPEPRRGDASHSG
jgi:hypothetical protein